MARDAPGMKGYRPRDASGELRGKRDDTHVGAIERNYDVDLNMRSDAHLGTALKRAGVDSLDKLLKKTR